MGAFWAQNRTRNWRLSRSRRGVPQHGFRGAEIFSERAVSSYVGVWLCTLIFCREKYGSCVSVFCYGPIHGCGTFRDKIMARTGARDSLSRRKSQFPTIPGALIAPVGCVLVPWCPEPKSNGIADPLGWFTAPYGARNRPHGSAGQILRKT